MRFSAPSALKSSGSAHRPVPSEQPSLLDLSQVLEGLIPAVPCGLVSCHWRSWGSPFRVFPSSETLPGSSPGDTLSTFLFFRRSRPESVLSQKLRPQGFVSRWSPFRAGEYCILDAVVTLLGFSFTSAVRPTVSALPLDSTTASDLPRVDLLSEPKYGLLVVRAWPLASFRRSG
jgi:hypothetical protein